MSKHRITIQVIKITKIRSGAVNRWKSEFSVKMYNACDNAQTYSQTNSEEIDSYLEKEEIEAHLKYLRDMVIDAAPNLFHCAFLIEVE